jgi:hypothetical protein
MQFKSKTYRYFQTIEGRIIKISNRSCKRSYNNQFTKLKNKNKIIPTIIGAMDIETMDLNGIQKPILISFACKDLTNGEIKTILNVVDKQLLKTNIELAIKELWISFFESLTSLIKELKHKKIVIYMHNLGSFDGYFLFPGLLQFYAPEQVESLIDKDNNFIQIALNDKDVSYIWKDSFRLFPISLKELAKTFKSEYNKLHDYNPNYNTINLFNDENKNDFNQFLEYSLFDSLALLDSMLNAQSIYIEKYNVDIGTVFSTSTLSLKIFRSNFLHCDIPALNKKEDSFIRRGYYGGATDYYKLYGENLFYYDVNSLYPFSMCNDMPHKIIDFHNYKVINKIGLNNFFGFALVEVTCPKGIKIPLLPYNDGFKLIYPTGKWIGVYFSEELKDVVKHGYKIKMLCGYEFSKETIFNDYVEHFYNIKKLSIKDSPERFVAKMQLNQLYGYFGRSMELILTRNTNKAGLKELLATRVIRSIIELPKNIFVVLMSANLNYKSVKQIGIKLDLDNSFTSEKRNVKSNVAISAAVTAYARIVMNKYKTIPGYNVYYTDTDSIFLDEPLPETLIGNELGQMKDELDGNTILKAYFLGVTLLKT